MGLAMSKYDLLLRVTTTGITSPLKPQFQSVKPGDGFNSNMPAQTQAFELTVSGVGAVSASAQIIVSNDTGADPNTYNWVAYGDPITAAGTDRAMTVSGGTQPWRNYAAYITAISGTNAEATLRMSA